MKYILFTVSQQKIIKNINCQIKKCNSYFILLKKFDLNSFLIYNKEFKKKQFFKKYITIILDERYEKDKKRKYFLKFIFKKYQGHLQCISKSCIE